jgi:hypothetical protein
MLSMVITLRLDGVGSTHHRADPSALREALEHHVDRMIGNRLESSSC